MGDTELTVLVVDDDPSVGRVLTALLEQAGVRAVHETSGEGALRRLRSSPVDLVLTDLRMPGMDGLELLRHVTHGWPEVPVILLTAHGTITAAVEAMKVGAADFMLKPFEREEVIFAVRKALKSSEPLRERPPRTSSVTSAMVGASPAMRAVEELIRRAAATNATVMIRGESGTGKELVARAIHVEGPRRQAPFVPVHCAALPESLLESELFGYEKGAFTGATSRKPGRVELAEGGTLFLDEIGDLELSMQVKLLRLLQEKEYQRVGGTRTLRANVRFVTATHRDLEAMVQVGRFREDLYYRISVLPIVLPPLRERGDDVGLLARHFCRLLGAENGRPGLRLTSGALARLAAELWPGNVRQLQNLIERLVILTDGATIGEDAVAAHLTGYPGLSRPEQTGGDLKARVQETERRALLDALERARDNRSQAARLLGISRRALYNKLAEFGIG